MNMFIITLLYCTSIFAGIIVALYLRHLCKQEERDELKYIKVSAEEEQREYFAEQNRAFRNQQKAYSTNGAVTSFRNR